MSAHAPRIHIVSTTHTSTRSNIVMGGVVIRSLRLPHPEPPAFRLCGHSPFCNWNVGTTAAGALCVAGLARVEAAPLLQGAAGAEARSHPRCSPVRWGR